MFDENPFRDYKNWLRQRKLQETSQGEIESLIPNSPDDPPKAKNTFFRGGQHPEEIEDVIHSTLSSEGHLKHISEPGIHNNLTSKSLGMLLDQVEEERHDAKIPHGEPFSETHGKIVDLVRSHPNATDEHHRQIGKMEEKPDQGDWRPGKPGHPLGFQSFNDRRARNRKQKTPQSRGFFVAIELALSASRC